MGLNEDIKNLRFDTRMVDWNIKHGKLSEAEANQYLESLEDVSSLGEDLNLDSDKSKKAEAVEAPEVPEVSAETPQDPFSTPSY